MSEAQSFSPQETPGTSAEIIPLFGHQTPIDYPEDCPNPTDKRLQRLMGIVLQDTFIDGNQSHLTTEEILRSDEYRDV